MQSSSQIDVTRSAEELVRSQVASSLKLLLETKHLYQTVHLTADVAPLQSALEKQKQPEERVELARRRHAEFVLQAWPLVSQDAPPSFSQGRSFCVVAPIVKLYCARCKRVEPCVCETIVSLFSSHPPKQVANDIGQLWALTFQCQSCRAFPQAFLVARHGHRLSIAGRHPIEEVVLPTYIPKEERKHFSDAVVAFNSGFILAALFYLRVFVEQYSLRVVARPELQGEALLDAYAETLPLGVRQSFPSLRDVYSQLSAAVHTARASDTLFGTLREKTEAHLEAVHLYRTRAAT